MKKLTFWAAALIAATLLSAFGISQARADVINLTINSAQYFDGQYFVGPYNSTITAHDSHDPDLSFPAITFCIDFESHASFGQSFEVRPINLADFHGPEQASYWEAGYIYLQMANTTNVAIISIMQRAAWSITNPGSTDPYLTTPNSDVSAWVLNAQQNYQSVAASTFTLYLTPGHEGQSQISINAVPEPGTYAMAAVGLLALIGFNIRRKRA